MSIPIQNTFTGVKVVYGIPESFKPILGLPGGKVRIRMRPHNVIRVFVRSGSMIQEFYLIDEGDNWRASPDTRRGVNSVLLTTASA